MSNRITLLSLLFCIQLLPHLTSGHYEYERSHRLRVRRQAPTPPPDTPKNNDPNKPAPNLTDITNAVACTNWTVTNNAAKCNDKPATQCGYANGKTVDTSNPAYLGALSAVATGCSPEQPFKAVLCSSYQVAPNGAAPVPGTKTGNPPKGDKLADPTKDKSVDPTKEKPGSKNAIGPFNCTEQETKKSMTCTTINVPIKCLASVAP